MVGRRCGVVNQKRERWFLRPAPDASAEPGGSCDQEPPCPDDDTTDGLARTLIEGESFRGGAGSLYPAPMSANPRLLLVLVAALLSSGCSWTFIQRGPTQARHGEFIDCREDKLFPIVDAGVAVLYPVGAGVRLAAGEVRRSDGTIDPAPPPQLLIPAALLGGAIFAWSAWTGHLDTEHCRKLHAEKRLRDAEASVWEGFTR